MAQPIFYTYQTSGACAGVYTYDCMHQMEKTDLIVVSRYDYKQKK